MTSDTDTDVRNWSTYTLGSLEASAQQAPLIRDALWARIHDRHIETRTEAFRGLANQDDKRGVIPFRDWLSKQERLGSPIWKWEIEVAGIYGDPALFEVLTSIARWWGDDTAELDWALARCGPDPVLRAKTPREFMMRDANFEWHLSDNGTSVVYGAGEQVIDLHNDCELTGMCANDRELVLTFRKLSPDTGSSFFAQGEKLVLAIAGARVEQLPEIDYPCNLTSLQGVTNGLLTLEIEGARYVIRGSNMTFKFMPG